MRQAEAVLSRLVDNWEHATATDFGALALAICITAWFVSRYCE